MNTTTTMHGAADAAPGETDAAVRQYAPLRPSGSRPPGPRGNWMGLSLLGDMRRDYLGFATARQRQYGDVCAMHMGHELAYDLFSPDLVREALVDNAEHLVRWERGVEVFAQTFGQSVLTTEGPTWQRQRRMLMPAFTPRRVAGYAGLMSEAAVMALERALPPHAAQAEVDMDELFSRVAMDVILRTLFGEQLQGEAEAAIHATRVMSETAMREMFFPATLPDWLPLPGKAAKRRALRTLRGLVQSHIDRRRALPEAQVQAGEDLLARLLALRDEDTGEGLSAREVFDQCIVSFQAGHETTATALLWWSRLLAAHPEAAARAREEVDAVLAGRAPGADAPAALPFLTATLKEAMRLYPPVAALMARRTLREITVGGWTIPPGTLLYVTPWVLHRDRRWWAQPDEFRPERFLPGAPAVPRSAYLPFGLGPRVCIGQHFAMLEMTLVAVLLLQRYELSLPADASPPEPVLNVTLRPKGGVRLRLWRRT
ncbi:cytochrome P450 [Azohydromonas australica]|uniref:cytochrome P450 n=1 Tax=Azohydromonas australica TaxID=364039 RepID=UPI00041E0EE1|nr:cytochrome P450 [Azohydromonas australica]